MQDSQDITKKILQTKKPVYTGTWSIKIVKKIWFAKQSFIVSVPHILVKNNTPKKGKKKNATFPQHFF